MSEYIDDFDWRVHLVTHAKWTQKLFWKTIEDWTPMTLLSKWKFLKWHTLWFLTPSMSAMFLKIANESFTESEDYYRFKSFRKFWKQKWEFSPKDDSEFISFLENRVLSVIMAVSSLECYLNTYIPLRDFEYIQINKRKWKKVIDREGIEKLSIWEKVWCVYPQILGLTSFDLNIWRSFSKIKDLRHRLIHLKNLDFRNSNIDDDTIWNLILNPNMQNPALIIKDIMKYLSTWNERFLNKLPF